MGCFAICAYLAFYIGQKKRTSRGHRWPADAGKEFNVKSEMVSL